MVGTASRGTGLLRNPVYKGQIVFNRSEWKSHPETGNRGAVSRSEDEWITVEAPELVIVPAALYDDVQNELDRRSTVRQDLKEERRRKGEARKAAEAAEAMRKRRLLLANGELRRAKLFFSGRLYCEWSGKKIASISKGLYGCKTPGCRICPTGDDFINATISNIFDLTPEQILNGFETDPAIIVKKTLFREKITVLEEEERQWRDNLARVLDMLGDTPKREEIRAYLKVADAKIRQTHMQRSTAVRELRLLSPTLDKVRPALELVLNSAARLRVNRLDHQPNKVLRTCIRSITVHRGDRVSISWDMAELMKTWRRLKSD